ncbi:MAG: sigma-54-dependent Fis family transcriptional regulator [Nitrospirae bacterium]|nr:sigma-54-dependent Fis family transcriptional regulator [Nitrospirota bacterium]
MPKILVVDDDEGMLIALKTGLSRLGHDVHAASSAHEALEHLEADTCELVLSDVKMPGITGLDLLREVRRRREDVAVVLLTAYATVQDAVEAMKAGASDYLLKPFSIEALEKVVDRVLSAPPEGAQASDSRESAASGHTVEIVTQNGRMAQLLQKSREAAESDATVLILGESGTGKELFARFVHEHSPRRRQPFIAINCAALPEGLLESELFGYEKGAFTGAIRERKGKFELAHRGTLLLDEIGEMPLHLQAKLLRVLQERAIDRLGARAPVPVDIRVIATTNRDLKQEIAKGQFREDLFYRLHVIPLTIPPLRERPDDVDLLAHHFMRHFNQKYRRKVEYIDLAVLEALRSGRWRGNVRELENLMERAVLFCNNRIITAQHLKDELHSLALPEAGNTEVQVGQSIDQVERALILKTLDSVSGNRTKAANILGISVRTLRNKLHDYRIEAQDESVADA